MKFTIITALLAASASALPTDQDTAAAIEARQFGGSSTRNDLSNGNSASCPPVIFIYARGSTETGNLGTLGPSIASKLEAKYGKSGVWIQGVGGAYRATLGDNALPRGTSTAAIREMVGLFNTANIKCPDATLIAGGYSQGAALAAASITDVDSAIREKIAGTVLFGYTKNQQNNGRIPSYPAERTKVFCNAGDLVCTGSLVIAGPHLMYQSAAAGAAPEFLIQRVAGVQGSS
ncbi:cutinase-domain-containing protein [Fusarium oxysporum]|uniref:Cutinase n=1 Tax=Fusarium oxysporum TaxID=5507 RepID=A0A420NC13_FUSOX|nr:cutinase-domain-containing protein [Fusarium oxysporum]RKK62981.1 Cutinase 3 [Fusarium oxysporum]RKK77819.1 Cutinase 3 [Fusarium oxysporum]